MQRQPSRVTALQYFIGCMMPESANALQANAAIIEMIRLSLQVHRSAYGPGLPPDLPAIARPVIYSGSSLELLPAIAPKPDNVEQCLAPARRSAVQYCSLANFLADNFA